MRWLPMAAASLALLGAMHCSSSSDDDEAAGSCNDDADGVVGGAFAFEVTIDDAAFAPLILKAQNSGEITLTVKNAGTKPHDFVIGCQTVQGCTACFPDAAKLAPLDPGASKTVTFTAPKVEGIYTISSDVPGDAFTAQFVLQ